MESFDSSPNYTRATGSSDAKKENSPQGGSECDDIISVSSSTCGSSVNGPYAKNLNNNGIKYRTSNKKTLKNFRNVRSFRRRAKTRVIQSPIPISDEDSPIGSAHSSPHYLKATTSSECKKTHSQTSTLHSESPSDENTSHPKLVSQGHKPFQTLSRTSSLRSVRILIKKSSFKPKRSSLTHSKASEDVDVNRATYSSTLKDSKFPAPVELLDTEKSSAVKVCRYHHCSLHGRCQGSHDPVPPLKRFLYKKRRSLKKQKSMIPKSESRPGGKINAEKKKNLQKSLKVPTVEPLDRERIGDNITLSGDDDENVVGSQFYNQEAQLFGDGYQDVQQAYLVEVAFGETSFPERSYQDNLDILQKYSLGDHDFGGASFGPNGHCLGCSCHHKEDTSSNLNGYSYENSPNKSVDDLGKDSSALSKMLSNSSGRECAETPSIFDEATETSIVHSSSSDRQSSSDSNSEEETEFTTEATTTGDSKANEAVQVEDSVASSPVQTGGKLQFSKPRHISMWHLIQQNMLSNLSVEPTNKTVQGTDGESQVNGGADSLLVKESTTSSRILPDSDTSRINSDSETQEIEIRKLFAIKLVREAIEKILLPEVQDQTSDDQSVMSESTPRPEIMENNQSEVYNAESDEANPSSNPKEAVVRGDKEAVVRGDVPSREIKETGEQVVRKSVKKAPKHWSNLKKWILLQRFIRELEKVRKFNPRKPQILPLNPNPEAEKVNLRPQTVDGRKSAEEWMLDYALRQAVSQLAPTQKRKVSLLVRAFETVVPPQEESQVQFRIPRIREKEIESVYDVKDNYGESLVKFRSSNGERTGQLTSNEKPVVFSRNCTSMDERLETTKENQRKIAGDHLDLQGIHKDTVKVENIIENDTEKQAMVTIQGLEGEAAVSDCIDGKVKDHGQCNQMDRKSCIKMWHMIYRHVVSGIAEKVGSQLLDGAEADDEVEENGDLNVFPQPTDDLREENHVSSNLRGGLTKSDALKLVKEAVAEILLPEIQDDSSDTQSVTSESVQDQDIAERNCNEIGEENKSSEERKGTKAESEAIKKNELAKPKNWSKLKRLILLKRSIKALEKARKFKPETNQLSSQNTDPEPEKIDLRRQMMDERKKAEQWMLDYAVQHIVTKLTPARKRRVSMLVEAFEAVVPLPEI